jgi:hypothetical protein
MRAQVAAHGSKPGCLNFHIPRHAWRELKLLGVGPCWLGIPLLPDDRRPRFPFGGCLNREVFGEPLAGIRGVGSWKHMYCANAKVLPKIDEKDRGVGLE